MDHCEQTRVWSTFLWKGCTRVIYWIIKYYKCIYCHNLSQSNITFLIKPYQPRIIPYGVFVQLETHLIRSYVELSKLIDQQFPSVRIYTLNNHFSSWSQNPKIRFQTPKPERSSTGCRKTRNSEGKRPTNLACSMIFEPPTIPCHPNLPFSQFHLKNLRYTPQV